jgi:hypothetical protein
MLMNMPRSKNCSTSGCVNHVAFKNHYHPVFQLPRHVLTIHSDLNFCGVYAAVITDPPVALPLATSFLSASHGAITITTARPGLTAKLVPLPTNPGTGTQPDPTPAPDPQEPDPPTVTTRSFGHPSDSDLKNNAGGIIADSRTTIQKDGPAVTIGDTTISVKDSGVTVSDKSGTRILPIPKEESNGIGDPTQSNRIISINGHNFMVDAARNLVELASTLHASSTTNLDVMIDAAGNLVKAAAVLHASNTANSAMTDAAGNLVKAAALLHATNTANTEFPVSSPASSASGKKQSTSTAKPTTRSSTKAPPPTSTKSKTGEASRTQVDIVRRLCALLLGTATLALLL